MRGFVERMEFLDQFADGPVTVDDVIESYLMEADAANDE